MSAAPDLLFLGGRVFTADPARPYAQALAVRDGRVAAVGPEADLARTRGPRTEIVDLAGGLVLPGFVDAHVHPIKGGMERARCNLAELTGLDAYLERIAAYAAAHPDRPWIQGGGWSMATFPGGLPRREVLDRVCPDRPAYLINSDHHGAWVNTRALELAGIDAATPDPADGRIERDPDGTPTGMLHEGAMDLVGRIMPRAEPAEYAAALLDAQRYLFSHGITGWQDAIVGPYAGYDDLLPTYLDAARSGALKARVTGALWWDRARGAEQIEDLEARRAAADGLDRFRAGSVKIMQDGVAENFTAGMLDPYLDATGCPCEERGLSYVDPHALRGYVRELDRRGFQVHFHAIGDRAVREALDSLAEARAANGPNDLRHHIAHLQVLHPADVPRFAELDVAANIQALWATHHQQMDELTTPFLGPERNGRQYPFGDLLRTGARLCMGSDWPVTTPDPLAAIHVAVHRTEPSDEARAAWPTAATPFLPHQRIALAEALHAYTAGSAWINHRDHETGRLVPGLRADLTVLDRDPFALPPEDIWTTQVRMTFIDADPVYERP
ncbi:MAG TPA: amidohydrolase [Thermomonospora sp.]|nr:amidohydrolase [Thermomonospora sp.]